MEYNTISRKDEIMKMHVIWMKMKAILMNKMSQR